MMTIKQIAVVMLITVFFLGGCSRLSGETETPDLEATPQDVRETEAEPGLVTIAEIQGVGHISPLVDQEVTDIRGLVTVVRMDGFWMESMTPDDDPATSEGILVLTELVPAVRPGDEVSVDAVVRERVPGGSATNNLSVTQLEKPVVSVLSQGNELPPPVILGEGGRIPPDRVIDNDTDGFVSEMTFFDPDEDGLDFFESLEGMRVQINNALVVGATNAYKEIVVVGDLGVHAGDFTPRGGLVVRPDDFNPERIILDDRLIELPFVQAGDYSSEPIIGVVDFEYGNYKILPFEEVSFSSGGLTPQGPIDPVEEGQLRVASYNVENLSAKNPDRILILAGQIVNLMASPDIIGLQEIQDNNGAPNMDGVAADHTYQGIIDAVLRLGGPEYAYVNIDPKPAHDGGEPGGNIRVGYLYRLDSGLTLIDAPHGDAVTPVEVSSVDGEPVLSLNPGRIDPTNPAFTDSRKPLVAAFNLNGKILFVVNNHFNSKGGDTPLFGSVQPPDLKSEFQRLQQAQIVHDFVAGLLRVDPNAQVIVLGDLNDFQFSATVDLLAGDILNNLIERLPVEERYNYVYDGNSQALDHILVSEGLVDHVEDFMILHINSEFDDTRRFSDHDVLIATFAMVE